MRAKICPVCKNKFYSEDERSDDDSFVHYYCTSKKKSQKQHQQKKPIRTSTPVAELENSPTFSSLDSVTDFFYQSWKSGLHLEDTSPPQSPPATWNYQPCTVLQPICYAPQIVCVNTVIFQPCLPASYVQQVGYRPDGTFGVLPPTFSH